LNQKAKSKPSKKRSSESNI